MRFFVFLCCVFLTIDASAREHFFGGGKEATPATIEESFEGRDITLFFPTSVPEEGHRPLVVALHGGGGNADHLRKHLKLDEAAQKYGFVVAYLNGTDAAPRLPAKMRAWNAGGRCCGLPEKNNVDDISYILGAVRYIQGKYGIDTSQTFGIGHSNGAMMTQTLMCRTGLYAAAVPISGPLNIPDATCSAAKGKKILAIHGVNDRNVPIGGGLGTKGVTDIDYASESHSKQVFEASGASYTLHAVEDAEHYLLGIDDVLRKQGSSIGEEAAAFFGLTNN